MGCGGIVRLCSIPCCVAGGWVWPLPRYSTQKALNYLSMYCRLLELHDFRNFPKLSLELPNGPVVVLGRNGQGKSNLLESLLALTSGRGRAHRLLSELILRDRGHIRPFARIRAEVISGDYPTRLELVFSVTSEANTGTGQRASRRVVVDGKPRPVSNLLGHLNSVHFSPNDIELLSGGPAGRRRFLDVSISQVDPNYVRDLVDYGRVVSQRNALLRELRERRGTSESLGFWNEKLIELGQRLVEVRRSFVEVLNRESSRAYCELSGSDEVLATEYLIADGRSLSLLNEVQKQEIERGQTLVGPHRDDLNIVVNEQPVEAFASRGQQRLVVLSLRLAEVKWLSNESNDVPVLLLDDIFSELDPEHREAVIYRIPKQAQVFITAADDAQVPVHFGRHAAILRISEGNADWESQSS